MDHRFDVNNHTLQAQGYWQTNIDALNVNGQRIASLTDSIIDAGTTLILGDNKTVQAIQYRLVVLISRLTIQHLISVPCLKAQPTAMAV